jgi:hypothetical protein
MCTSSSENFPSIKGRAFQKTKMHVLVSILIFKILDLFFPMWYLLGIMIDINGKNDFFYQCFISSNTLLWECYPTNDDTSVFMQQLAMGYVKNK